MEEQRTRSNPKLRTKLGRKKRKGRRTEDQIEQEEIESDLEGRRKELRKKKKRCIRGTWRMGNMSFKYLIQVDFFPRLPSHATRVQKGLGTLIYYVVLLT